MESQENELATRGTGDILSVSPYNPTKTTQTPVKDIAAMRNIFTQPRTF
jgi:hypothetical protein